MEYIIKNATNTKIKILKIFLIIILLVFVLAIFISNIETLEQDRLKKEVEKEFYAEIDEEYDVILRLVITRDYRAEIDELLPEDIKYALYEINILAIVDGDNCVEHKYIACVFYRTYWVGGIIREPYLIDCDFAKVKGE